jgi:hypothetical protein
MAGLSLSFKVAGIERLLKKLDKETVETPLQKGIRNLTLLLERLVKTSTPVDSGRLRSSIYSEVKPLYGKVGTIVEYAPFVEYGTRPHTIVPKHARALVFTVGGETVFAQYVRHPGMQARHVVEGSSVRVLGQGPFHYALDRLKQLLPEKLKEIGQQIETIWSS